VGAGEHRPQRTEIAPPPNPSTGPFIYRRQMDRSDAAWERLARFGELVDRDPVLVPLDQASLAMAAVLRDATDEAAALGTLDELAAALPERTFAGLRRHLYDDVGFTGDGRNYDDPANSYLDVVLRRRRGLPILLATVMIEVGRRAGVAVLGIGMPMHFLVADPRDADALVDPFTGAPLDRQGAEEQFRARSAGRLEWDAHHLDPVPAGSMVARMLANLHGSFGRRGDRVRQAMVAMMRWRVPELAAESASAPRVAAPFN
jgi:regulator of sirC expression with transglutaminase-like and TPR domain